MKHENNGFCPQCQNIFNRYPGFNENLKSWFLSMQTKHHEMHISCAGRGEIDQEAYFAKGSSKAHYGQSAHNYGCAIDLFVMDPKHPNILYPNDWFIGILQPNLPKWLLWYGAPGSLFHELPHVELRGWQELVRQGIVKLVE